MRPLCTRGAARRSAPGRGQSGRRLANSMKEGIHPDYRKRPLTCVAGFIETRSTKKDIKIEICSQCHPFMTGKQKIVDTEGRVERFKKKYAGTGGKK